MPASDLESLRRIPLEIINQRRLDLVDELFAPDIVEHNPPPGMHGEGLEGWKAFLEQYTSAFPDLRYELVHDFMHDDLVIHHAHVSGTMRDEFLGLAPTGKKACWTEMHITRVRDGKAVEHWSVIDAMSMIQQLGLSMPEMEQAA